MWKFGRILIVLIIFSFLICVPKLSIAVGGTTKIEVDASVYPTMLEPGDAATLTVTVKEIGDDDAVNVVVKPIVSGYSNIVISPSSASVSKISEGSQRTFEFKVLVPNNEAGGSKSIRIYVEFTDPGVLEDKRKSVTKYVSLTVKTPTAYTSTTSTSSDSGAFVIGVLLFGGVLGGILYSQRKKKKVPKKQLSSGKPAPPRRETPSKPVPDFPPELFSKYEPLEFLGEGGFARVYRVKRKKDGKVVAVKVPSLGSEAAKKAFLKEVKAWSRLDHPNIVKLYGAYKTPIPHIEMEYVEGARIRRRLVRDLGAYPVPADEKTALKLVRGIAEGLKHAHSKQVYHRDLKPQNVLLKSDLTPKITDWGLAKVGAVSTTATAMKGLTYLYAAPEQVDEKFYGHTDHRTDIYQLGLIFYELLTGGQPYEGSSIVSVMTRITKPDERPKPPSAFNPKLKKYDGIFEKLLAKRKEERYQSVDEFLEALDAIQEIQREKKELKKTTTAMVKSKTRAEFEKLWRTGVLKTVKIARLSLRANDRGELLGALDELRGITRENSKDVEHLIGQVEILIREGVAMSDETKAKIEELLKRIEWEVFRS